MQSENVCDRLKKVWQTAQNIYIHDQYIQPSSYNLLSWRLGLTKAPINIQFISDDCQRTEKLISISISN